MTYQSIRRSLKTIPPGLLAERSVRELFAKRKYFIVSKAYDRRYHQIMWKRLLDIIFSVLALVCLSPLIALTAALVKISSPGPVFFKQERIGINRRARERRRSEVRSVMNERRRKDRRVLINFGKPFTIYKFRTMILEAECGRPVWASKDDPRITAIGKILRKTRIDEIPQFFNVLRGDMSIVGPRPERAFFIGRAEKEIPQFQLRLRAKPGITGLAQVALGYTNDTEGLRKKLSFDLEYIKSLSIWTDFRILLKTITVVLTGKGAC